MISVVIYNIQYGKKLEQITRWLVENPLQFDIICLQEFPIDKIDNFLKPFKSSTFAHVFAPGFIRNSKEYGQLTVFNTKKIKLIRENVVVLPHKSFLEEWRGNIGNRSALVTTFGYKTKQFTLVNTHLICLASNSTRRKQIQKIMQTIETNKNHPTILLGDFNYTSLIKQKGLFQFMENYLFKNAHTFPTNKLFFIKHQVDYVFYKNCQITDIFVGDISYSDHFPISFNITVG